MLFSTILTLMECSFLRHINGNRSDSHAAFKIYVTISITYHKAEMILKLCFFVIDSQYENWYIY